MNRFGVKLGRSFFWAILVYASFSSFSFAGGHGDEDPFPLKCTDFSGQWKSDSGDRYNIHQRECAWLKIQMSFGSVSDSFTIVPDNRVRPVGPGKRGLIRHRWNSPRNANAIESHRTFTTNGLRVTEITMFERASQGLLLQTTYRSIERINGSGQVQHEYEQHVFRKVSTAPYDNQNPKRRKH